MLNIIFSTKQGMLNVIFPTGKPAALNIVWRNPNPVARHIRQHSFAGTDECARYIQQEFIMDGKGGYWTTISKLEVVVGGQAA
jgi:hypothetical protein